MPQETADDDFCAPPVHLRIQPSHYLLGDLYQNRVHQGRNEDSGYSEQ